MSHGLVGQVIVGKFRIDRILAEGGMGLVAAATHLHLEQPVALKLPRGEICTNPEALARFTREAKAAAQMKSEHVARVLDAGVAEDGSPYMVMEYLEGHSLAKLLEMTGRLSIESAAEYGIQVCEGLAEAHARGIVHRDVKPDNLFLVERAPDRQIVKLLDFGISKVSFVEKGNLQTTIIMGSPCYMSPEQLRSTATVDHRTDLWSLGVTLFELLAGRGPFDGTQPMAALVVSILDRPAPDLRELRPEIPDALAAVVARCLAREREERFQSAAEVAKALAPFAPARAGEAVERAESMATLLRRSPPKADDPGRRMPSEAPVAGAGAPPQTSAPEASSGSVGSNSANPKPHGDHESAPAVSVPPPTGPGGGHLRRSAPVALITLSAVIVAIVALAAHPRAAGPAQASPNITAAPAPPGPPRTAEVPGPVEKPTTTELFVRATPASARVTVDGIPVTGNPYRGRYPRGEVHLVEVWAHGYDSKFEQVSLTNDVFIDVSLEWHAPTSRRSAPPPPVTVMRHAGPDPTVVAAGAAAETPAPSMEVDPTGGHAVVHPIESSNPYGVP